MVKFVKNVHQAKGRCIAAFLLLCAICLNCYGDSYAVPDRLKAAYLYNFAKLTYWPTPKAEHQDQRLVICTSASDTFTQTLKDFSDKPIAGRSVQVVALGMLSDVDFCHMVFVDKAHSQSWLKQGNKIHKGQLLVGEFPGFIDNGGVINFFLEGDKLRFEISLSNAQQHGLQLSSRLLKLARVRQAP